MNNEHSLSQGTTKSMARFEGMADVIASTQQSFGTQAPVFFQVVCSFLFAVYGFSI